MKYITLIFISGITLIMSGCQSTGKVIIERQEIASSLPPGALLRIPKKIAYLDDGQVPKEVFELAIRFQKIIESGKFRDLIALEFPDELANIDMRENRIRELTEMEARREPSLMILEEISYSADPESAKIRSENWMFSFKNVEYRSTGSTTVTIYRTGNEKFRLSKH